MGHSNFGRRQTDCALTLTLSGNDDGKRFLHTQTYAGRRHHAFASVDTCWWMRAMAAWQGVVVDLLLNLLKGERRLALCSCVSSRECPQGVAGPLRDRWWL